MISYRQIFLRDNRPGKKGLKTMSRQGKHRDDKYRVQAYYEAEEKAIFVLVAKTENKSLTDTIKASIFDRAKALHILDKDGKISTAYKDALDIEVSIIQQAEHKQKGNRK